MPTDCAIPDYIYECARSLPPLPRAVQRLLRLAQVPDMPFRKFVQVVESDQTLMVRVLRAANSAIYGTSRRIQTVQQATVVLGSQAIIHLALSISVMNLKDHLTERWPGDLSDFQRHNLAVALLARKLARALSLPDPSRFFVGGLLHDIGKLILLNHFGSAYGALLTAAPREAQPLHLMEREAFGTDHAAAGYALCQHWKLPAALAHAVAEHHSPSASEATCDVVRSANSLAKLTGLGDAGNRYAELDWFRNATLSSVSAAHLRDLMRTLPQEVDDAAAALGDPADEAPRPSEDAAPPQPVHLHLRLPAARALQPLLWSLGCEPLLLGEDVACAADPAAPVAAVLTEAPLSGAQQQAYEQQRVPVLSYAVWCAQHQQPRAGHLDAAALRAWMAEHLTGRPSGVPHPCNHLA